MISNAMTVEELHEYCEVLMRNGRAKSKLMLDPRGLRYLTDKHEVYLMKPLEGDGIFKDDKVFIKPVF